METMVSATVLNNVNGRFKERFSNSNFVQCIDRGVGFFQILSFQQLRILRASFPPLFFRISKFGLRICGFAALGMGFSVRWCVELEESIEYSDVGWQSGVWPGLRSKQRGRNHTKDSLLFRCVDDAFPSPLTGLGGNDTLVGLNGNDSLFGGLGRDFLIGGRGLDVLNGNEDEDLLISGYTLSAGAEDSAAFLQSVRTVWFGTGTFATRVAALNPILVPGTTVIDEGNIDTLTSNADGSLDRLFAALADGVVKDAGDLLTLLL